MYTDNKYTYYICTHNQTDMWYKSFTLTTREATCDQLWNTLTDVENWSTWDHEIDSVQLTGSMEQGATFHLKPKGGPRTRMTVDQFARPHRFADIAHLPLAKMETVHTFTETGEGVVIKVEIRITGLLTPLWARVIGEKQIEGGPEQALAMVRASTKKE